MVRNGIHHWVVLGMRILSDSFTWLGSLASDRKGKERANKISPRPLLVLTEHLVPPSIHLSNAFLDSIRATYLPDIPEMFKSLRKMTRIKMRQDEHLPVVLNAFPYNSLDNL